ncbi:MAG: class I SAM-dependent methyltransferase [Parvibaculum sp.]|nr:class I SAM-dependent methyltransferase [Parvibaculum sp.]
MSNVGIDPVPDIQRRQQDQYVYPYHHIPFLDERGQGRRSRMLDWGFEYLLYNHKVVEIINALTPNSVLDVGCGDGYLLGQLPDTIQKRVGVDINARALGFAKAFFPNVEFKNCDVSEIEETFDVVCAIEVIEHIPDDSVANFLALISARVSPGGSLIISVPTTNEPLNSKHFRHYDLPLLEAHLSSLPSDFMIVKTQYYYRKTLWERIYRKLTKNLLIQGEIPLMRRFVWQNAKNQAGKATSANGLHLIAILRK